MSALRTISTVLGTGVAAAAIMTAVGSGTANADAENCRTVTKYSCQHQVRESGHNMRSSTQGEWRSAGYAEILGGVYVKDGNIRTPGTFAAEVWNQPNMPNGDTDPFPTGKANSGGPQYGYLND